MNFRIVMQILRWATNKINRGHNRKGKKSYAKPKTISRRKFQMGF